MIPSIWAPGWFWILFPRIAALPRLSRMLILLRTLYLYCIDFMLKGPCLKFPKYKIWIGNYPHPFGTFPIIHQICYPDPPLTSTPGTSPPWPPSTPFEEGDEEDHLLHKPQLPGVVRKLPALWLTREDKEFAAPPFLLPHLQ